jgi:hypothetical protein
MEHRGLDFTKTPAVKKITDSLDDQGACEKDLFYFRVGDEIKIALAIANFNVGQTMPLFRQGVERFTQKTERLNLQGELPCLGPENLPFQSDEIADIQPFKEAELLLANDLFLKIGLYLSIPVLQLNETGLAKIPDGHNPARKAEALSNRSELFLGHGAVGLKNFAGGMGGLEIIWIGIDPFLFQGLQFPYSLLDQFIRLIHLAFSHFPD